MTYPVYTIENYDAMEQLGTKAKFWFYDEDDKKFLFKFGRPGTGENWSEKVASELAKILGISSASYDFAEFNNKEGVISESVVPSRGRLIHGNELLAQKDKNYPHEKRYKVREYHLRTVMALLSKLQSSSGPLALKLPIGFSDPHIEFPTELFIGYILFDCWISNGDRHHENWGIIANIQSDSAAIHLAPSYDHASSLGCRLSDENRLKRLETDDKGFTVETYVKRAKSAFYDTQGNNLKTIEAFEQISHHHPGIALLWLDRLENVSIHEIENIFSKVPDELMSEPAVKFAMKVLDENKKRLLEMKNKLRQK